MGGLVDLFANASAYDHALAALNSGVVVLGGGLILFALHLARKGGGGTGE